MTATRLRTADPTRPSDHELEAGSAPDRTPTVLPSRSSRGADLARTVLRPGTLIPALVLLLALLWAIVPGLFTGQSPTATVGEALEAPSSTHWFGTDGTGRDLYTRVVYGASHSISAALVAVAVGLVVGTFLGVLAGTVGGLGGRIGAAAEDVIMRLVDVLLAIPGLLLSLSIVLLLGFGTTHAAIAVGATSIATFARLARGQVIGIRGTEYVEAAYGSGGRPLSVLWRHILPNSLTPVIALAALQLGSAILQISTLGFLGYGTPPPTPEWGLLISEGRDYVATAWWLTLLPGIVVAAVVLSTNHLSDVIRKGESR